MGRTYEEVLDYRGGGELSYIVSWSGGKDSCFACYKAMDAGYEISHLVSFISEDHQRVRFHGIEAGMIQLQAEAIGIPHLARGTTWDGYEREFKETVQGLIPQGVKGMVFGDIHVQEHRDWVERVCGEIGIEAI